MTFQPVTNEKARFRLCCFTIFDMKFDFSKLEKKLKYYCKGRETCPTTGKEHWQCFGYSDTAQRWSWWKKLLAPHHFEMCEGDLASNETYCKKSGQFEEYGIKPMGSGKKRSLEEACEAIKNGVDLDEVAVCDPTTFVMYHNGLKSLARSVSNLVMKKVPRDFASGLFMSWNLRTTHVNM